jgi:DNA-directed RNA polymerase subunit RPC12/RpoP
MSGCSYSCLVFPAAPHIEYAPSLSQLEGVIRAMVSTGWFDSSGSGWRGVTVDSAGAFKKVPLQLGNAQAALEELAPAGTFWIELHNRRDSGDPTPFEEDAEGIFRPQYCESGYLFVSTIMLAVEDPYGTDHIACPTCGSNVLRARREHPDPAVSKISPMPQLYVGSRCMACGLALDLGRLAMTLKAAIDSPEPRSEIAPFFRFGVWLLPVEKRYPDTDRITLDPALPILLQRECGVPFRSVGTLSCS